jgi:hypothetical protein
MKRTKKRGQKITWSGSHSAWQWCCGNGTASNVGKREPREIEVTVLLFPSVLLPSFLPCFSHFYHLCFLCFISSFLSLFYQFISLSVFVSFVVLSFLLFFSLCLSPLYSYLPSFFSIFQTIFGPLSHSSSPFVLFGFPLSHICPPSPFFLSFFSSIYRRPREREELLDTIKELMSFPKCRNVEVINNPARLGSNHREVNYINYK